MSKQELKSIFRTLHLSSALLWAAAILAAAIMGVPDAFVTGVLAVLAVMSLFSIHTAALRAGVLDRRCAKARATD